MSSQARGKGAGALVSLHISVNLPDPPSGFDPNEIETAIGSAETSFPGCQRLLSMNMVMVENLHTRKLVLLGLLLCLLPDPGLADARTQAVALARAGQTGEALKRLEALYAREPTPPVLYDLVTVAEWHGDHERVRSLSREIVPTQAPHWALAAVARGFEALEAHETAAKWFGHCRDRSPHPLDCALAAAKNRAAAGDPEQALATVDSLAAEYPEADAVHATRARILQELGKWTQAADAWRMAAQLAPAEPSYIRGEFENLLKAGDLATAGDLVVQRSGELSVAQVRRLRAKQAARAIRKLADTPMDEPGRAAQARQVVQMVSRNILEAEPHTAPWRRARFDLVEAYLAAGQPRRAVSAWKELKADGLTPPAYVVAAACKAFKRLDDPRYISCLQTLATARPQAAEPQRKLFRAYLEAGRHQEARATIDRLAARDPMGDDARRAAVVRAWMNELAEATKRLEALRAGDPGDLAVRSDLATVYRWRGWPRRALATHEEVLAAAPDHLQSRTGAAQAQMDLGEHGAAFEEIDRLSADHPDARALADLRHRHRHVTGWGLSAHVRSGDSNAPDSDSRETSATVRLESPLLSTHGRLYVRRDHYRASFPEGDGADRRQAVGWNHRERAWNGFAEVHASSAPDVDSAVAAGLEWTPDDHWHLAAGFDAESPDVPLRGRRQGIGGEKLEFSLVHRWDERRRARVGVSAQDFDDGNRRTSVGASALQRLYTHPRGWLDGQLGLFHSRNSADVVPYFNPESDLSLTVSLNADWRNREWMSDRLRHRASIHVGAYEQEGFRTGAIGGLRYENHWTLSAGNGVRYGIELNSRIYDGDREEQHFAFLGFTWRWP